MPVNEFVNCLKAFKNSPHQKDRVSVQEFGNGFCFECLSKLVDALVFFIFIRRIPETAQFPVFVLLSSSTAH